MTLTAPGFGAVHRVTYGQACRLRRTDRCCDHGRPLACHVSHSGADPRVGQPLCADCYDYTGHVLWHAHAGRLWKAFTDNLYHHLASRTGKSRSVLRRSVRISYAKVAEYQRRAAVHVHAVMRLDGATGADSTPLDWADARLLAAAVPTAAAAVRLAAPHHPTLGEYEIRWGDQLDVRALHSGGAQDEVSDDAVAAYVAKYVTKGATESGAGLDYRLKGPADIGAAVVSSHVRTLMATCWRLGGIPELGSLRLREWAHTLGYRGHILTKSRAYSTTYAALREERAAHERAEKGDTGAPDADGVTESWWRFVGSGHTAGAALLAAGIAEELALNREAAREERLGVGP